MNKGRRPDKGVREKLDLVYQVEDQIRIIRLAWSAGDTKATSRAVMALRSIITPWFPEDKLKQYNEIRYEPAGMESLYTPDDRETLLLFGELDDDRKMELRRRLNAINEAEFFAKVDARVKLVMETLKVLDMGFMQKDDAVIDGTNKNFFQKRTATD